ncbi:MAG: TIGR03087 family PEP-CTERM/XrtA system glycosyltransferase [Planctomycetota bacterium]|nr:TIGR03087 family PEP-CTERM/XrtA system glycosyltransferase [Planctomycetota bacterium]
MRILFLAQRVPYPPNRGDKITTWRLVERLGRAHQVRIVAFAHDEKDVAAAEELRGKGFETVAVPYRDRAAKLGALPLLLTRKPLTLGVYGSSAVQEAVDRLAPESDLAYAYSSSMGAFLERHPRLPRIMHFGELDSDKWRQYAERTGFPMRLVYAREHRTLLEFERRIARSFAANVVCTPLEKAVFEREIPGATATVLRNGVDLAYYAPRWAGRDPNAIVFTGVMNYLPNAEGCVWFVREILPLVRREVPAATFAIVGSHPTPEVQRLAEVPGVEVTGFVDDTRTWLGKASLSVAPLRIARGIQNKVLEAMAMGLPVVGTTCATQGVEGVDRRDFRVQDEPAGFARDVVDLLRSPERALDLGRAARRFVEATYDWEVVFRPLDELVQRCRDRRPPPP